MANTYEAIETYTVQSGGVGSIDFNNIPQNYTDLVVKLSLRNTRTSTGPGYGRISLNGSTTNFTSKHAGVNEDGTLTGQTRSDNYIMFSVATDAQTASVFGNAELYITNYATSNYKSMSLEETSGNNASTNINRYIAGILWSNTSAITSLSISADASTFKEHSTATLYGIKKD